MPRRFNTTGHCLAEKHYMIPAGRRLSQIRSLIDNEHYFIIHAPRQTGKATLLRNLSREFAIGTGRADLVVGYGGRQDVIELKIMRGKYTLPDGLAQVARYAKRLGRDVGYLVIFDPKADTPFEDRGEVEDLEHEGVTVVVVHI